MVAVSLACAHAAAAAARRPLWRHLAGNRPLALPVPQIQIYGGGAHAGGRIDLQDTSSSAPAQEALPRASNGRPRCTARGCPPRKKGLDAGVADEGGYWPAFKSNEEGLAELTGAISDAGFEPGDESRSRSTSRRRSSTAAGRTTSRSRKPLLTAEQWHALLCDGSRRDPIVSIGIRSPRTTRSG